jgi:hypothetical protein
MNSYRKTNTNYTKMRLNEPTKFLYKLTHMLIGLSSTSCKKSHLIWSKNDLKIERKLIWEECELWERSELRERSEWEERVREQGVSERARGARGRRMVLAGHASLSRPPDSTCRSRVGRTRQPLSHASRPCRHAGKDAVESAGYD